MNRPADGGNRGGAKTGNGLRCLPPHNGASVDRPQAKCASCGTHGRIPTIASAADDPLPVLRIAFGARHDGGPALLCPKCREARP